MRQLLRHPSSFVSLPIFAACGLAVITYDLPPSYLDGLLLLTVTMAIVMLFDVFAGERLPAFARFRERRYAGTRQAFVALAFAIAVALFCLLDLLLFPIALISNPSAYATMEHGHEHIRHISDMCWVLPPIALLCARSRLLRITLIGIALVFPILVVDRNRMFETLFSLALVLILRRDESKPFPWLLVSCVALLGAAVFSVLGALRSGSIEHVALPFSALYLAAPQALKWLLLYVTAGPYNFAAVLSKEYDNASFLIHQVVPLSGSVATAGTSIPLDASNINVGTEFFPFLMALGPAGAVAAMLALYALLAWSVRLLHPKVPLFALLIFLRLSYVCVMAPFAPQAFIWMNFGFIVLCLVMQMLAALLPDRLATPVVQASPAGFA